MAVLRRLACNLRQAGVCFLAAACVQAHSGAYADAIVHTGVGEPDFVWGVQPDHFVAGQFELSRHTTITAIEGYFHSVSPASRTVVLYGSADGSPSSGSVPGDELWSTEFDLVALDPGSFGWSGASGLSVDLLPGTYWFSFEARGPNQPEVPYLGIAAGAPDPLQHEAICNFFPQTMCLPPEGWFSASLGMSVRVTGTIVPAPPALILLLGGLTVLVRLKKPASRA